MKRIDKLEEKYLIDVLSNQFETSKNNIYCSKLESEFNSFLNSKFSIKNLEHFHSQKNLLLGFFDERN